MKNILIFLLILIFYQYGFSRKTGKSIPSFPVLDNWNRSDEVQVYNPDNLYEYINGAADLYLSYDFTELQVAEYTAANERSLIIEIYIHKDPVYAFGIYSRERPDYSTFLKIGTQAHYEGMAIYFFKGRYYVKINSYGLSEAEEKLLPEYAKKVAAVLDGETSFPFIVNCFPAEHKLENSEKFVAKNYMSYDFFNYVFQADYSDEDNLYTMFIMKTKDKNETKTVLKNYLDFIKSGETEVSKNIYFLIDPYHGDTAIGWQDNYIWGIVAENGQKYMEKSIQLLKENLKKGKFIK